MKKEIKKEWKTPTLEILDVSETMKGWGPGHGKPGHDKPDDGKPDDGLGS